MGDIEDIVILLVDIMGYMGYFNNALLLGHEYI